MSLELVVEVVGGGGPVVFAGCGDGAWSLAVAVDEPFTVFVDEFDVGDPPPCFGVDEAVAGEQFNGPNRDGGGGVCLFGDGARQWPHEVPGVCGWGLCKCCA